MAITLYPRQLAAKIVDPERTHVIVVATQNLSLRGFPLASDDIELQLSLDCPGAELFLTPDTGVHLHGEIAKALGGQAGTIPLGVRGGAVRAYPPIDAGWVNQRNIAPLVGFVQHGGFVHASDAEFLREIGRAAQKASRRPRILATNAR